MSTNTPTFDLIVAIDFGTDGTALGFSIPNTKEVFIRQDWNLKDKPNKENFGVKMKTNILLNRRLKNDSSNYDDTNIYGEIEEIKRNFNDMIGASDKFDYEFIAFGAEATLKYQNRKLYNDSKNWLYFEGFKMALFEGKCTNHKQVKIRKYLEAKNGIKIKSKFVFIEAFKYIIRQVKLWIEKHKNIITLSDGLNSIKWVISVPAIWSDNSKNLMIEWFYLAGINRNNEINLVYEPDCASISVQNELKESNLFSKCDRYILLDLGGGTADFACHEIINSNEVCEIHYPSGGAWGSTYIDKEFEILLFDIFGKKRIKLFKQMHEKEYATLLNTFINGCKLKFFHRNFRKGKLKKKFDENSSHNIELPFTFIEYLEEQQNISDLEQYLNNYKYKYQKNLVSLHNDDLSLNYKIWFDLFNVSVNPILRHLKHLLSNKLEQVKYLILVGGFSESKYVQYKIMNEFGINSQYKLKVVIPQRPILCVVDGAVRLGLNPDYMTSRKLSKTYGMSVSLPIHKVRLNAPEEFVNQNKYFNECGEERVRQCFYIFAHKNQIIKKGQKVSKSYRRTTAVSEKSIYCSEMEKPFSCQQGYKMGSIVIPKPFEIREKYEIVFYFGGTIIKIFLKDKTNNKLSQTTLKYQTE